MKNKYFIPSAFLLLIASASHLYLSIRSYSLKADKATGKTICHIGEKLNCDSALTSIFSDIFGIPISNFGLVINAICLVLLCMLKLNWTEYSKIWSDWLWRISLFLALSSLVMLFISLIYLQSFCPFCVLCYVVSFALPFFLKKGLTSSQINTWTKKHFQSILWLIGSGLAGVLFIHAFYSESHSISDLKKTAQSNFIDWKKDLTPHDSLLKEDNSFLSSGASSRSSADLVLVEFADFLCPHCGATYQTLKNFQKIHPSVRIEYMHFPLNPSGCTENSKTNRNSASCFLSKVVFCASQHNEGLMIQDWIYTHQNTLGRHRQIKELQKKINLHLQDTSSHHLAIQKCIQSEESRQAISKHIEVAKKLNVQATPSLFVEGKKINPIAVQLTLKKILEYQVQKK